MLALAFTVLDWGDLRLHALQLILLGCRVLILPAAEAPMGVFAITVIGRRVTPWHTRAQNPKHRIDDASVIGYSRLRFPTGLLARVTGAPARSNLYLRGRDAEVLESV